MSVPIGAIVSGAKQAAAAQGGGRKKKKTRGGISAVSVPTSTNTSYQGSRGTFFPIPRSGGKGLGAYNT